MFNGLKAQRRLALYVALGLSAGSCTFFDASTVYAAHDYTETATSISGLEGTDKTHSMSDNNITIGTPGMPNVPFSTYGRISGGGKENATEDVSNNTLTIHGLQVSNGGGFSIIYGGISGTGAVTNNKVFFNNGLSKDPIYGGFNGASATKAVTGNVATVAGGTVEGVMPLAAIRRARALLRATPSRSRAALSGMRLRAASLTTRRAAQMPPTIR